MKIWTTMFTAGLAALASGSALAQGQVTAGLEQPVYTQQTAYEYESYYASDELSSGATTQQATSNLTTSNFGSGCGAGTNCCDPCGSSCCDNCCDSCCGSCCDSCCGGGCCGFGWCTNGWSLREALLGSDSWLDIGGWNQTGYHSESTALGTAGAFNIHPNDIRLHQQWLYFGHQADGSAGLDVGFWCDIIYGVDAQDTQAFGNTPGNWDFMSGLDHGIYGWAFPQLYGEVALGNLSVRIGHFYTIIGYEVVQATGNFFYSHAWTFFNTEPFTHTGALATWTPNDIVTFYGGWTAGWDTGFDQVNQGSNFLGGVGLQLTNAINFTYATTAGNFGVRSAGFDGYMHSCVLNVNVTDRVNYIAQSDYLRIDGTGEDDIGLNQYLIFSATDQIGFGGRMEWWQDDGVSHYAGTFGINIRPCVDIVLRPEVRHNWVPTGNLEETIFGVDSVLTF